VIRYLGIRRLLHIREWGKFFWEGWCFCPPDIIVTSLSLLAGELQSLCWIRERLEGDAAEPQEVLEGGESTSILPIQRTAIAKSIRDVNNPMHEQLQEKEPSSEWLLENQACMRTQEPLLLSNESEIGFNQKLQSDPI
jgi:hypothetical protein